MYNIIHNRVTGYTMNIFLSCTIFPLEMVIDLDFCCLYIWVFVHLVLHLSTANWPSNSLDSTINLSIYSDSLSGLSVLCFFSRWGHVFWKTLPSVFYSLLDTLCTVVILWYLFLIVLGISFFSFCVSLPVSWVPCLPPFWFSPSYAWTISSRLFLRKSAEEINFSETSHI